jgi:O-antigen/teichoic acid export membrane protein
MLFINLDFDVFLLLPKYFIICLCFWFISVAFTLNGMYAAKHHFSPVSLEFTSAFMTLATSDHMVTQSQPAAQLLVVKDVNA